MIAEIAALKYAPAGMKFWKMLWIAAVTVVVPTKSMGAMVTQAKRPRPE